jgi:hypothetical protein
MNLKQLGSNMTALNLNEVQVFFSYETPVAAMLADGSLVRTEDFYSVTTSKHINKWLDGREAQEVPQAAIDELVEAV